MNKEEKNRIIEQLSGKLDEYGNIYLADVAGLPVKDITEFRRMCHRRQISVQVVKNTFLQKAMERAKSDFSPFYNTLTGNTALLFTKTGSVPAKIIREFRKKHEKPLLKAAYVEETHYIGDEHLAMLCMLKSKNELLADVIFLLQSPVKRVMSALQSGGHTLSGILKTITVRAENFQPQQS